MTGPDGVPPIQVTRPTRGPAWLRLACLAVLVIGFLGIGRALGWHENLTVAQIRSVVEDAGWLGVLAFVALFVVGQMLYVPNLLFVLAGALVFGPSFGAALSLCAALLATSVNFVFVRCVGGQPFEGVQNRRILWALARLEARPRLTLGIMRLLFFSSPTLTAAMALSPIRFRDHFIGSFIGMIPQAVGVSFLVDRLI